MKQTYQPPSKTGMDKYRALTEKEIQTLEHNGCTAEDWTSVFVDTDFAAAYVKNTTFYGDVNLGVFEKNIEAGEGIVVHSGLRNVVLRDVTIGDNCLIENVSNYISRYDIGEECYISGVGKIASTGGATFGQGETIAVLNEAGRGNVKLFEGLTSQLAAFMVRHHADRELIAALFALIERRIAARKTERGVIGYRVKIVNTKEIVDTNISDDCEINGASCLGNCTLEGTQETGIYVGHDVICENTIVTAGAALLDGAKIKNCFVGEACHIGSGFTATDSVFFANSHMDNGEACASFCGPFTVSHHKSTLLIGGMFSFYNAGSGTNYSNHAYKLGPVHYGTLARGSKTASGAHLLMPASIGAFSMCMGKIPCHPDTRKLPFSYLLASGDEVYLVPGRNLTTVGTYRDVGKWQKRDVRPRGERKSLVHFDWLNPVTVGACIEGKRLLEKMLCEQGVVTDAYRYEGCLITPRALQQGIVSYDMAIRLFIGMQLSSRTTVSPVETTGADTWIDLSGLLMPEVEGRRLAEEIRQGIVTDVEELADRFLDSYHRYEDYLWAYAYELMKEYYQLDALAGEDLDRIRQDYRQAHDEWLASIRRDAEKEFALGDVEEETRSRFLASLH